MNPQEKQETDLSIDQEYQEALTATMGTEVDPNELFENDGSETQEPEQEEQQPSEEIESSGAEAFGEEKQDDDDNADDPITEKVGDVEIIDLNVKEPAKEKPKKHYDTEAQLWQARYDRLKAETDKRLAELEAKMVQSASVEHPAQQQQYIEPQKVQVQKSPAEFMPSGFEDQYNPAEAAMPGSLSYQAYQQYQQHYQAELQKTLAQNVETVIEKREKQRQAEILHTQQIEFLKSKIGEKADSAIDEIVNFIQSPSQETMYQIWMAMELSKGRLPLSQTQFSALRNRIQPKNIQHGHSVASGGSGAQPQQRKTQKNDLDNFFGV